ncbi:hypothetical protein F5882DRAFT_484178 [Hyaloscypha sp. PMI_1271]|nr:hypothetical protein F5882DRAFT_484178 [Hyaloscypha sp. PMI_1271]
MPPELMEGLKRAQRIRQACDCCHARKIRCDGEAPCKNCRATELQCTYLAVPKKKGPKGWRTVREFKPVPIQRPRIFDQAPRPESFSPIPMPWISLGFMKRSSIKWLHKRKRWALWTWLSIYRLCCRRICLDAFFIHKFPIMPILDQESTYSMMYRLGDSPRHYGLIVAICALVESMTLLQLQGLHEEITYINLDDDYSKYCRRTFWLLIVTERGYVLQRRNRPLTLQRTIELPAVDNGSESTILSGFNNLVSLFEHLDDSNLGNDSLASPQSLVQLQDILKGDIPNMSERTEIQQADLLVSKQWLKTMVWQLCVRKGFLSSSSSDESLSFHYPIVIARDMVHASRILPIKAFEADGIGILEKVFDIGCSLSDVLLIHPHAMSSSPMVIDPRNYLMELVRVLGTRREATNT